MLAPKHVAHRVASLVNTKHGSVKESQVHAVEFEAVI